VSAGQAVASVLLLAGSFLALLAGLGLVRLPDVFARMHAATKPATLGLVLICLGAGIAGAETADVAKLLLVVALQFLTAPVGAHMVARAAYHAGGLLDRRTVLDELAAAAVRPGRSTRPTGQVDGGKPSRRRNADRGGEDH
jgi:multicomponent Na+:H+ antiporter subunit G